MVLLSWFNVFELYLGRNGFCGDEDGPLGHFDVTEYTTGFFLCDFVYKNWE